MISCSKDPGAEEQLRNLTKWSSQKLTSGMQIYVELKGNVDICLESQRIETKLKKILSTVEEFRRKKITKDTPLSEADMNKMSAWLQEIEKLQQQKKFLQSLYEE